MASSVFFSVFRMVRRLLGSAAAPTAVEGAPDPGARLSYANDGRSGHVHYQSAAVHFTLYYEIGGGDCVATIDVPGPADWTPQTGLPLAQRGAVLDWIGRQVVRDQCAGNARFALEGDWLNIYPA
jgi:hypothetical protein